MGRIPRVMVFKVIKRKKPEARNANSEQREERKDPRKERRNWRSQLPIALLEGEEDARFIRNLTKTIEPLT